MERTGDWQWAVATVCDPADTNQYVDACQLLDQLADETRLDELDRLLDHDAFTAREAALTPYARLAGVSGLGRMIHVLRQGRAEGLDNDGPAAETCDVLRLLRVGPTQSSPAPALQASAGRGNGSREAGEPPAA